MPYATEETDTSVDGRREDRHDRRDERKERRRQNRLRRIKARLKQAVAVGVMDQTEADAYYEEVQFSDFFALLPILMELIQMIMDFFQSLE